MRHVIHRRTIQCSEGVRVQVARIGVSMAGAGGGREVRAELDENVCVR